MDTQKQQITDRLKQANNILVTVSSNPSVDQLAACIGLTLVLNKMGKHATAVFSGQIPNTIEFLQPEKTLEKNTDSLRDFIIALDKSKADKLRYKVEDKVVKIFITPYKTSINEKDLEFSQGDFNVDVVMALGVHNQADLDQAITAHGRILHDAVVVSMNVKPGGELGTLNWMDPQASSLSELVVQLIDMIDKSMMDGQMATSLLTGIVAETERFGNAKTSPLTMSISAELMAAGANQQLVATKLEEAKPRPQPATPISVAPSAPTAVPVPTPTGLATTVPVQKQEGTLEVAHPGSTIDLSAGPEPEKEEKEKELTPQIDIDHEGTLRRLEEVRKAQENPAAPTPEPSTSPHMILQPPTTGGQPGIGGFPQGGGGLASSDPLSLPSPSEADMERPSGAPAMNPSAGLPPLGKNEREHVIPVPSTPSSVPLPPLDTSQQSVSSVAAPVQPTDVVESQLPADGQVVTPAQAVVAPTATPGVAQPPSDHLVNARDLVHQAIHSAPSNTPLPPISALNAQPVDLNLRDQVPPAQPPLPNDINPAPTQGTNPNAPPPGPPPMMPPMQQ